MSKLMWTGSDVLFATRFIGGREFPTKLSKYFYMFCYAIFVKIADLFIEGHYVVSEHLISELKPLGLKKPISVLIDPPKYLRKYKKIPHKGFNILYYRGIGSNQVFNDWVYGYDVFLEIKSRMPHVNLIEVNGNNNMEEIYPIIDVMIRPNRHDGCPRMVIECKTNDIPYYWSKENPKEEEIINFIKNEIKHNSNLL